MKKYVFGKLIALAVASMIVLITLSFVEVAIYSYLINPGHPEAFYDGHAMMSAPYISGIFGFIIFYSVAWYWKRKAYEPLFKLVLLFPLTYILLDLMMMISFGVHWSEFILTFLVCNGAKFLGSYMAYKFAK